MSFLRKRRCSDDLNTDFDVVFLLASVGESSGMRNRICLSFANLFYSIGVGWWASVSLLSAT